MNTSFLSDISEESIKTLQRAQVEVTIDKNVIEEGALNATATVIDVITKKKLPGFVFRWEVNGKVLQVSKAHILRRNVVTKKTTIVRVTAIWPNVGEVTHKIIIRKSELNSKVNHMYLR